MVKKCLITRPKHDLVTAYLYYFSESISTAKSLTGIHVSFLEGPEANRANFEDCISKEHPNLVFLNGHGNKKEVAGHQNEIILDEKNIDITIGKIIYALSCDSLEDLGQLAVEKGAKAYIGYKARFMFVTDPSREATPSKDKNALPFKRACTALMTSLLCGRTVKEAIDETKKEYEHSIKSFGTSEDDPYGPVPLIRFSLAWNLEFLDMCGDPESYFSES